MALQLTLRVAAAAPADQTADFLRRVEDAGFAGAGIPDTQLIMRDVYIALALAAQRTSQLTLHTAVVRRLFTIDPKDLTLGEVRRFFLEVVKIELMSKSDLAGIGRD